MDHGLQNHWESRFLNTRAIQAMVERRAVVTRGGELTAGPSFDHEGLFLVSIGADESMSVARVHRQQYFEATALADLALAMHSIEFSDTPIKAGTPTLTKRHIAYSISNPGGGMLTVEPWDGVVVEGSRSVKVTLIEPGCVGVSITTTARALRYVVSTIDAYHRHVNYDRAPRPAGVPPCDGDHPMPACADPGCWLTE